MNIKEEAKRESSFLNFCSQKERELFIKDVASKVKIETVTSSSDIKLELEDSMCSQNEEHYQLRFNETIEESEKEIKMDIKEENWWMETEESCSSDAIKDETCEAFHSTKTQSLYKEDISNYTSDLFSSEDSGNGVSFSLNKDSAACESDRKCETQEIVVIHIPSVETNVYSERPNQKTVSMGSCSKQSKLLHESNKNKQDFSKESCKSILSHEYRKSYECDVSEKCLKYPSHLEKHRLFLHSREAKRCDIWDKHMNQLSSPKTHELIDAKRTHKCSICSKAFTQLSHLKSHTLIHQGIKPHKCDICNKAFTQLPHLKTHKLIHEGIKPHKCNICSKAFTEASSLKKHKWIHEGIKRHKCDICDKAFTELSHLKRHKLIHEGIKAHKCNICNKTFTQVSSLKLHKLIHEGTKQHKCNICNKAFIQVSHLKSHKVIHEGIKPHKCNICNTAFTQSSSLQRHKLIHKDAPV